MLHNLRHIAIALVVLWYGLGAEAQSQADLIINTPTGLSPGDTFRIVFLTDGMTDATSTSISSYNTFVTNDATTEAAGGNVTYNGVTLTWNAIASTSATSAVTNIGETGASIYLADGVKIAQTDNSSGLWSGSILHAINADLTGTTNLSGPFVWSGTNPDGSTNFFSLGTGTQVQLGGAAFSNGDWINVGSAIDSSISEHMYGISQELTVPGAVGVPEPSTLWMAMAGTCAAIAYGRAGRRWKLRASG